jgi:hypothetical protein
MDRLDIAIPRGVDTKGVGRVPDRPEQVVRKLATADRMLGEGKDLRTRSAVSRQRYGRGTRYCFTQPVVRQW